MSESVTSLRSAIVSHKVRGYAESQRGQSIRPLNTSYKKKNLRVRRAYRQ
jgi:hypothetical protein